MAEAEAEAKEEQEAEAEIECLEGTPLDHRTRRGGALGVWRIAQAVVEKSISQLPDHCQLVFNLMRGKNMKNSEIAEELGISVVTVKSQLRKAQMKLRADIVRYYHDREGSNLPDIRMIGQYFLALGFTNFEYIN